MSFKKLHQQKQPLLLCNVWDVASARIAKQLKFDAIGTSSAAIASMLGYKDGQEMSFNELKHIVQCIAGHTSLPLTVDLEAGYGANSAEICDNIKALADIGVVGINLEDSTVDGARTLSDAKEFAHTITTIQNDITNAHKDVFMNVRTDTFLLDVPGKMNETRRRIKLFEEAGADGIFVPCIEKEEDIVEALSVASKPLNVMCMPKLPSFERLKQLSVKRISMGNFLFERMTQHLKNALIAITSSKSFNPIFDHADN